MFYKVLAWPHDYRYFVSAKHAASSTPDILLWDPQTNKYDKMNLPRTNIFCSGHAFLADGRLLVVGGNGTSAYGKTVREEGRFLRIETATASPMDLPAPAVPLPLEPAAIPETTAAPLSLITPPVAGTPELRTQVFRLRHISRAVAEPIVRTMLSSDGAILDSSDELSLDPAILRTSLYWKTWKILMLSGLL